MFLCDIIMSYIMLNIFNHIYKYYCSYIYIYDTLSIYNELKKYYRNLCLNSKYGCDREISGQAIAEKRLVGWLKDG